MDVLTDVLDAIRFDSVIFLRSELHAPWAVRSPPSETVVKHLLGLDVEPLNALMFHFVLEGEACLERDGGPPIYAGAGDIFLVAGEHTLADREGRDAVDFINLVQTPSNRAPEPLSSASVVEGQRAMLACGTLLFDCVGFNPIVQSLPDVVHVPQSQQRTPWLRATLRYFLEEGAATRSGSEALLGRLAEIMFVEVARSEVHNAAEVATWLDALEDEHIGAALRELHAAPGHDWTVEEIARKVGVSRSGFAARFCDLIGEPPMSYLTRWRMQKAASLLRDGRKSMHQIAEHVGYSSPAAFSRAFKRHAGRPPGRWAKSRTTRRRSPALG